MTKEQEEAIEKLKRELNHLEYTKDLDIASDNYFGQFEERINTIRTVLSMLSEQEKELQALKDFEEIANSKVTELNPIRISKSKSINK